MVCQVPMLDLLQGREKLLLCDQQELFKMVLPKLDHRHRVRHRGHQIVQLSTSIRQRL